MVVPTRLKPNFRLLLSDDLKSGHFNVNEAPVVCNV